MPNPTPIDQLAREAVDDAEQRHAVGIGMEYTREPALAAFVLEVVDGLREIAELEGKTLIDATKARRYDEGAADAFAQTGGLARSLLAKHGVEL